MVGSKLFRYSALMLNILDDTMKKLTLHVESLEKTTEGYFVAASDIRM